MMFKKYREKKKQKLLAADSIRRRSQALSIKYQEFALDRTDSGVVVDGNADDSESIVVSLTTFDKRIDDVYLTIESLFQQSRKANKVVLWVSAQDFSMSDIPEVLKKQCQRGLEIEFCEEDLGPYTKFYYAVQKYPNSLLLTVDDDIIYPIDTIDMLYRAHLRHPDMIHCHRAHEIVMATNGKALPYKQWHFGGENNEPSINIFPTGVGGVLYFPGCFDDELLNKALFKQLCPFADDVWLKAMSLKKGTVCKRVKDSREWSMRFVPVEGSQKYKLKRKNKQKDGGNDAQINAVFEHYDLWKLLK